MTFLAPAFLLAGLAFAGAMVALHLITRDRPPRAPLPTARFVPGRVERAMTRAVRPADPFLLVVRVLVLVLAAAAFARPVLNADRRTVARVVVLDRSRAVADPIAARDSALALLGAGDALVLFDSSARVVSGSTRDTLAALDTTGTSRRARGSLSAALIAAQRAAAPMREHADSIELVVVAAFAGEEVDAATGAIRALWPGRARLVQTRIADPRPESVPELRADADDPLAAAVALLGAASSRGPARIVRGLATSEDSAHARGGAALIIWPPGVDALGWPARHTSDTAGAVVAGDVVLIAPFERRHAAPERRIETLPDAGAGSVQGGARTLQVVARWIDGEPAAVERALGAGCIREVGVPVDPIGDLALRRELRDLVAMLGVSCGGRRELDRLDGASLAMLAGEGPLVDARRLEPARGRATPLVPWLLGAAMLLALLEPLARRFGRGRGRGRQP